MHDARIVEEHVELAVLAFGGSNHRLAVCRLGDIRMDVNRGLPGTADFRDSGFSSLVVEVHGHHFGTFLGEQEGGFAANAAGCTRDEGDFVFQSHESFQLPVFSYP